MVQLRARNNVGRRGVEGREDGGMVARSKKERMIRKQESGDDVQQARYRRGKRKAEKMQGAWCHVMDDCDDIQCMEVKKRNERCDMRYKDESMSGVE